MNLKPLYEKIVVEIDSNQEIKSKSGLTYNKNLSTSAHTTLKGKVLAVGEGRLLEDGSIIPLKVKVGDTVIFSKMQGESYEDSDNTYTILSESHILAILDEEEELNDNN